VPQVDDALPLPADTAQPQAEEAFVLTEVEDALIISGNTGMALTIVEMVDGQQVLLRPALYVSAEGQPFMSLRDLVDCYQGWTLAGSSADGVFTLNAAGYEVVMQLGGADPVVTVDGAAAALTADDVLLRGGVVYVGSEFLEGTIGATVIFDQDESSVVLFIRDKSVAQSSD